MCSELAGRRGGGGSAHVKCAIKKTSLIQMVMASLWISPWLRDETLGQRRQSAEGRRRKQMKREPHRRNDKQGGATATAAAESRDEDNEVA